MFDVFVCAHTHPNATQISLQRIVIIDLRWFTVFRVASLYW